MKITYHKKPDKLIIRLNENQPDNAIEVEYNFTIRRDSEGKPVMIEINQASQVIDLEKAEFAVPVAGKIDITRV